MPKEAFENFPQNNNGNGEPAEELPPEVVERLERSWEMQKAAQHRVAQEVERMTDGRVSHEDTQELSEEELRDIREKAKTLGFPPDAREKKE